VLSATDPHDCILGFVEPFFIISFYFQCTSTFPVRKTEIRAVGIRRADHTTPFYPQKLALTSSTSCGLLGRGSSLRTKATESLLLVHSANRVKKSVHNGML
jgi:hypothetical protein